MPEQVKGRVAARRYDASRRRAAAGERRKRILDAARELFATEGYAAVSVARIAEVAGVAVDTVYAAVGRKPQLLLAVHDMELAGGPAGVAAEDRDYVRAVREAAAARDKLAAYAAALAERLPRTVPLQLALRDAGATDPECRTAYEGLTARRMANMRLLAADLRATGELRPELTDERVAVLIGTTNSAEFFDLVARQGCAPGDYAELVRDLWVRTLLT